AYRPGVGPPEGLSGQREVKTEPVRQNCSRPRVQLAQVRQESTMHPTAAVSPTLKRRTLLPTRVTRPRISCPGTIGYCVMPHSLRAKWMSEWQTPQNRM